VEVPFALFVWRRAEIKFLATVFERRGIFVGAKLPVFVVFIIFVAFLGGHDNDFFFKHVTWFLSSFFVQFLCQCFDIGEQLFGGVTRIDAKIALEKLELGSPFHFHGGLSFLE
jgi:hypothetical protein